VAVDVAALRAHPNLPANLAVSGLVYDVQTELVETVVPAAALRSEYHRLLNLATASSDLTSEEAARREGRDSPIREPACPREASGA